MFASLTLSGCLWPTPLHEAPSAKNVDEPPSFVEGSINPPFGPLSVAGVASNPPLNLVAVDPNPDEPSPPNNQLKNGLLHARLFLLGSSGPSSRVFAQHETTLTFPAGTDFNSATLPQLTGSFFPDGSDMCALYPNAGDLFVVLADRDFSDTQGMENQAPGGLTSENHWELDCK